METIELTGRVTDRGELELELPTGLPSGDAFVTIDIVPRNYPEIPKELRALLAVEPLTGAEIVEAGLVGGWADEGLPNGQDWVESQRRERRGARRCW